MEFSDDIDCHPGAGATGAIHTTARICAHCRPHPFALAFLADPRAHARTARDARRTSQGRRHLPLRDRADRDSARRRRNRSDTPSARLELAMDARLWESNMSTHLSLPRAARAERTPAVIALHCSGGSGRAWRNISPALGGCFNVLAPDLIGNGTSPHWRGPGRFRLADEAASVVKAIDASPGSVHLVGHSFGGAVALRAAVQRPHRIASLSLYEPVAFHVLAACGD